jgi:CheY-like chemotaxis protein
MDDPTEILLVEDNPNDIELILAALSENQIADEVFVARDGEEALDYLHRRGAHESRSVKNPKVVLLDLKLPKVDGLEVLGRIKTDPDLKKIPVVMLTSSREERELLRSYNLGTNAYVVKPMSFTDFIKAVKEVGLFWGVINQSPGIVEWKT